MERVLSSVKKRRKPARWRTASGATFIDAGAEEAIVPVDAVTASGSGLDPHISLQNAQMQIPRVAKERGLSEDAVRAEVAKATDKPLLGLGGEPGVNVLKVNLALDAQAPKGALAQKKS